MTDKIEIPRRRVPKNWYVGLDSDHHVDRLHPDVHDDLLVQEATKMARELLLHLHQFLICLDLASYFSLLSSPFILLQGNFRGS